MPCTSHQHIPIKPTTISNQQKNLNNRDCPRCNKALNQTQLVSIKCPCVATSSHNNGMKRSQATSFSMRASLILYHTQTYTKHKRGSNFKRLDLPMYIAIMLPYFYPQNTRANARHSKVSTVSRGFHFTGSKQAKISSLATFAPCAKKQKPIFFYPYDTIKKRDLSKLPVKSNVIT